MSEEKWGVGNAKDEKAFDTVIIGSGEHKEQLELIHGEHPHSRRDNTTYARDKSGSITGFDGFRIPFKIEIEEFNYMKSSGLSGDEIRKGCSVKVFVDGIQIYDEFARGYENGYRKAHDYILSLESDWDWFPKVDQRIGRIVGYGEQLFKVKSFIVSQGCMIIETLDGNPRKRFLWEDLDEDLEGEHSLKVEINAPALTWYPKYEGMPEGKY